MSYCVGQYIILYLSQYTALLCSVLWLTKRSFLWNTFEVHDIIYVSPVIIYRMFSEHVRFCTALRLTVCCGVVFCALGWGTKKLPHMGFGVSWGLGCGGGRRFWRLSTLIITLSQWWWWWSSIFYTLIESKWKPFFFGGGGGEQLWFCTVGNVRQSGVSSWCIDGFKVIWDWIGSVCWGSHDESDSPRREWTCCFHSSFLRQRPDTQTGRPRTGRLGISAT